MNFSKKNHEVVGQNDKNVKKSQKHDANLQKNSTLYFQVGLILTLLATYGLFEMEFQTKILPEFAQVIEDEETVTIHPIVIVDTPKPVAEKVELPKKKVITKELKIVKDDVVTKDAADSFITDLPVTPAAKIVDPGDIDVPDEPDFYPVNGVEMAPIYPGCEGLSTNTERIQCMQGKLNKLISRKFDTDIVSDLGLSKKQRIYVNFKIDQSGNITDIRARSPHSKLEKEALKVAKKIPKMKPARQIDKNVAVMYTLPITIQVKND